MTRGTNDALEVKTDPPGAKVEVTRTNRTLKNSELKANMTESEAKEIIANKELDFYGPLIAETPASFKLKRKGKYTVVISKPGYETVEILVNNKIAGAGAVGMAGNALVGGLVGVAVDASTGATLSLTPNPIDIKLEGIPSTSVQAVALTNP